MTSTRPQVAWPAGEVVYFDTIAWNRLHDHPGRERLLERIRGRFPIMASALNVAEIARTTKPQRRRDLCRFLQEVHDPEVPLLEHPLVMAGPVAEAILRGEPDFVVTELPETREVQRFLRDPDNAEKRVGLIEWRDDIEAGFQGMLCQVKQGVDEVDESIESDGQTREQGAAFFIMTNDIRDSPGVVALLLRYASLIGLTLSEAEMLRLCDGSRDSVWTALRGYALFILQMTAQRLGKDKRPNAIDLLQTLYMGLFVKAFVTDDGDRAKGETGLLVAAKQISKLLTVPCPVLTSTEFFTLLLDEKPLPVR